MAVWLLLQSGFPSRLPREIARVEAPDLDTALPRLLLLAGKRRDQVARSAKEAFHEHRDFWVQSEASALLGPEAPRKKPAAMRGA